MNKGGVIGRQLDEDEDEECQTTKYPEGLDTCKDNLSQLDIDPFFNNNNGAMTWMTNSSIKDLHFKMEKGWEKDVSHELCLPIAEIGPVYHDADPQVLINIALLRKAKNVQVIEGLI